MRRVPHQRVLSSRAPSRATGLEDAMGNFEKLSVLVIVVIIVMILVVALYTWTDNPDAAAKDGGSNVATQQKPAPAPDLGSRFVNVPPAGMSDTRTDGVAPLPNSSPFPPLVVVPPAAP